MTANLYAALDLGGTKIAAAVLRADGTIVGRARLASAAGEGAAAVTAALVRAVEQALEDAAAAPAALAGVGVGAPGPIDTERGVVAFAPNLGLSNFPLAKRLSAALQVPVMVDNDVNLGTYGEYLAGAAAGRSLVLGVFPGTGIGGSLIVDGVTLRGWNGSAGEIGHTIIVHGGVLCACGQRGCLEAYASRTAIARDVVMLAATGHAPTVRAKAGTRLKAIKSGLLARAIDAGDQAVAEVVDRAADYLGVGIANCVNLFGPQVVVVGGGLVEKLGNRYLKRVTAAMRRHALRAATAGVEVVAAALGDDAVLRGAAGRLIEQQAAADG